MPGNSGRNGANGNGNGNGPGYGGGNGNGNGNGLTLTAPNFSTEALSTALVQITGVEAFADAEQFYFTTFQSLNGSGVSGSAILAFDEDTNQLTVHIQAAGLEPGMLHPQHIHGFPDGTEAEVPTPRVDRVLGDSDGFIELAEGLETYGPILLPLTQGPDPADDPLDFPVAEDGTISFTQTYDLDEIDVDLPANDPMLGLREIVLHGMTLEEGEGANGGEANGEAGYKVVLPVAAGAIEEIDSVGDLMKILNSADFPSEEAGGRPFDMSLFSGGPFDIPPTEMFG